MSDSEFQPSASAPATVTHHRNLAELYHAHPAPETKRKETLDRKQKEAPETTSHETTVITKSVKVEGSGSRGRVQASDFNELTQYIIEKTILIYHAQIACVEPFPECTDDRVTVKQAWLEVCSGQSIRVDIEDLL